MRSDRDAKIEQTSYFISEWNSAASKLVFPDTSRYVLSNAIPYGL